MPDAKFCKAFGAPTTKKCDFCENNIPLAARHCRFCGMALETPSAIVVEKEVKEEKQEEEQKAEQPQRRGYPSAKAPGVLSKRERERGTELTLMRASASAK